MVSNRRLIEAEGPDFYPTPAWGTQALLKYVRLHGSVWEPCCGDGDMAEVIKAAGYQVTASDIVDRGYGSVGDFLTADARHANIVTNPPFNIAEAVLAKALALADQKVCLLLRTAFLESRRRYETIYRATPPSRLLVFTERLSMYPKGHEVNGGGTTSYSWFVWDKEDPSRETRVTWVEPGLKPGSRHDRGGLLDMMEACA